MENKNEVKEKGRILNEPGLPEIHKYGLYQIGICTVLSILVLLNACGTSSYVMTTAEVSYRCLITECENPTNTTLYPLWLENAVPYANGTAETCSRFLIQNLSETCLETTFTHITQNCNSWVYDPAKETIISEWDLTCSSNQWKLTLVSTVNNVGQLVALIYAGYMSDRYGRRTLLVMSMLATAVCGLIQSLSLNYWMYVTFVFLDKALSTGLYPSAYLLVIEILGPRRRYLGASLLATQFRLGDGCMHIIASWVVSWRAALFIVHIPFFSALLLPHIVPESISWLIACGGDEQANKTIRKIVQKNGFEVTDEAISEFKAAPAGGSTEKCSAQQLLRSPVLLTRLVFCTFCWTAINFVYKGLSLNSTNVAGNTTITYIMSTADLIVLILGAVSIDLCGRKVASCSLFLLTGVTSFLFVFIPSDFSDDVHMVLFKIIQSSANITFIVFHLYTAEMFPTTLRHSLLSICFMAGGLGLVFAQQSPHLAHVLKSLPIISFGIVAITAGLLSLTFPETMGEQLPATVHDAERIGKKLQK